MGRRNIPIIQKSRKEVSMAIAPTPVEMGMPNLLFRRYILTLMPTFTGLIVVVVPAADNMRNRSLRGVLKFIPLSRILIASR